MKENGEMEELIDKWWNEGACAGDDDDDDDEDGDDVDAVNALRLINKLSFSDHESLTW